MCSPNIGTSGSAGGINPAGGKVNFLAVNHLVDSSRPAKSTIGARHCQRLAARGDAKTTVFFSPRDGLQRLGEVRGRTKDDEFTSFLPNVPKDTSGTHVSSFLSRGKQSDKRVQKEWE